MAFRLSRGALLTAASATALVAFASAPSLAQGAAQAVRDVITVTATKRPGGVDVQGAPIAVTAYGEAQLEALNVRDLESLSYAVPNVQLEDIGTTANTANFSIRGLGVNSSIPSIDPTVGLFVDGMYLGINTGVVLDTFDLEAVEVLRGPQGILFGRNVTGGAVLMRTTTPGDELRWNARAAVESGPNYYASAVVSGPITDVLGAKLAIYRNDDQGYFINSFDGSDAGLSETTVLRGAVTVRPNDDVEFILRYEHGDSEGDGPLGQNHVNGFGVGGLFPRGSAQFSINEIGFGESSWNQFISETNINVDFGNGTITNIFGHRNYDARSLGDIDATPRFLFHAPGSIGQDQFSNELRYAGTFGNVDVTAGLFYFNQHLNYVEQRLILGGAVNLIGGGVVDTETWGLFSQFDWHLNDALTLTAGGRFSDESKDARVQTLLPPAFSNCAVGIGCNTADFVDDDSWSSFSPKLGFQYELNEASQVYGFWTTGFRSGGYNLRNTSPTASPGPFDQEEVSSFELGYKTDFAAGAGRVNVAVFHNDISDMQREVNLSDPFAGVVQIIRNTADATIQGFEIEGSYALLDNLVLLGAVGYVDGQYDSVLFDISGDGNVNAADLALDIPRLAPWTYNASIIHDAPVGNIGTLTSALRYSYRDAAAYTDSNRGFFEEVNILDVDFTLSLRDDTMEIAFYGKNLLDEITYGNDTQLPSTIGPAPLGGTFSPLDKGVIYGVEFRIRN